MAVADMNYCGFNRQPRPSNGQSPDPLDCDLEALIDLAGRDKVFARAISLGWMNYSAPPKWVWRQIAADIIHDR